MIVRTIATKACEACALGQPIDRHDSHFYQRGVVRRNFVLTNRSSAITNALMVDPELMGQPLQWYRIFCYGFAHTDRTPEGGFTIFHLLFNMALALFSRAECRGALWPMGVPAHLSDRRGARRALLDASNVGRWSAHVGCVGSGDGDFDVVRFQLSRAELLFMGIVPMPRLDLGIMIVVGNMIGGRDSVAYDVHLVWSCLCRSLLLCQLELWLFGTVHTTR